MVALSVSLPRSYMLGGKDSAERFEMANKMLHWASKDDKWPIEEGQDFSEFHLVGDPTWVFHTDAEGNKHPRNGRWIIRFRVPESTAKHIRDNTDEKKPHPGYIKIYTERFQVLHQGKHFVGDFEPQLVHRPKAKDTSGKD